MARLAIFAALAGLLILPAAALASGEPKGYRGTLVIDQSGLREGSPAARR
jgi:hypothetical protein